MEPTRRYSSLRILTGRNVKQIIEHHLPVDRLVNESAKVFYRLSHPEDRQLVGDGLSSSIQCPSRTSVLMSNGHTLLTMVGEASGLGTSVKMVSIPRNSEENRHGGSRQGRDRFSTENRVYRTGQRGLAATTVVFEETNNLGGAKAIINARELTALRTAVGSLLATELLICPLGPRIQPVDASRPHQDNGDTTDIGVVRERAADRIPRPIALTAISISKVCTILNRSRNQNALKLQRRLKKEFDQVTITLHAREDDENNLSPPLSFADYTQQGDIICFATSATEPLVQDSWIKPGTHLILVGSYTPAMREVSTETIRRASMVVVDSRDHAMAEAGELISANLDSNGDIIELGELLECTEGAIVQPSPTAVAAATRGELTIFKSVGLAVQDVMISNLVHMHAKQASIGTVVDRYDGDDSSDDIDTAVDIGDSCT